MFKYFLFLISLFLAVNPVLADNAIQIDLSASVDRVEVGESFQVSVVLKNASTDNINIGNLSIPGISNFEQRGSSRSTKIQILNGATTAINETVLTLIANKEGEYEIGPVEIKSNGISAKSEIVKIVVEKSKKKSFFNTSNNVKNKNLTSQATGKNSEKFIKYLINIGALALLVFLVYAFNKQKKREKNISEEEKGVDEREEFENREDITIPEFDDEKFYEKTKASILLFLQKKYKIDTEVLTSDELVEALQKKNIRSLDEIKKALELCDQGSFAKNNSIKDDLLNIINKIYEKTN